MKETLRYLYRLSKGFIAPLLPLLLIGTAEVVLSLVTIAASKKVIDVATGDSGGVLAHYIVLVAGLMALSIASGATSSWLNVRLNLKVQNGLRYRFFGRTIRADWQKMQGFHSGDIMARINTDIGDVSTLFTSTVPSFFLTGIRLVGAFFYLFSMNSQLALVLAAIVPVVLLFSKIYFKKMRRLSREIKQTSSLVRQFFQESIQHTSIIKALRMEKLFEKRLEVQQNANIRKVKEQNRFSIFTHVILSVGFSTGYLITFSWGLFQLHNGEITFGTLTAFLQLVGMIQGPALGLINLAPSFVGVYTAAERLQEIERIRQEDTSNEQLVENLQQIQVSDVSFGYLPGHPVLDKVNLHFDRGTMTALTGRTGCGKTTMIRLLLGLVRPQGGEIVLTDDTRGVQVSERTRVNFTYVPQENQLFSGTIRENLKIGNPDATDEQLKEVLRQAAAEYVLRLPEGLDTHLKEQGEGLSGGQIQRLALARALLFPGQILLLDEVTSSLDEDTEAEIVRSIREHLKNRIVIIVSHKQKVIDACDKVYRFD